MPEISVVVPVYKVEKYLNECVDSILTQSFADFELILVDDGSPDNCGNICDDYAKQDTRIIVIHQENKGLSAARNTGIDAAKGRYITFIDSDDFVSTEYLEALYNGALSNKCDISTCKNEKFKQSRPVITSTTRNTKIISGREAAMSVYNHDYDVSIIACGKLYNTVLFIDKRFPAGMIHEDNYIVPILLYESEKICLIDECMYFYRQRNSSIIGQPFSIKRYDGVRAIENCIDYFRNKNDDCLVNLATKERNLLICSHYCEAKKAGIHSEIPKEYRVSEIKALLYLKRHLSYDKFTYRLSMVHPEWIWVCEYIKKIKHVISSKVKV